MSYKEQEYTLICRSCRKNVLANLVINDFQGMIVGDFTLPMIRDAIKEHDQEHTDLTKRREQSRQPSPMA